MPLRVNLLLTLCVNASSGQSKKPAERSVLVPGPSGTPLGNFVVCASLIVKYLILSPVLLLVACATAPQPAAVAKAVSKPAPAPAPKGPSIDDADAFVKKVETEYKKFSEFAARTYWVRANFITYDTNWLVQRVAAESTRKAVGYANEAKAFNGLDLKSRPDLDRKIGMIKKGITLPAPEKGDGANELAEITTRLASAYSTGKVEMKGKQVALDELEVLMGTVKRPSQLEQMWTDWRKVGPPMKKDYVRMVEIANDGARELGFKDVSELWLSKYDMPAAEMAAEVDRLWGQVKPLYDELHCYVRARLNRKYGSKAVPLDQPIRADLLGNMWAQQWSSVYADVAPRGSRIGYDLTRILKRKRYTPTKIVETGDKFFQSLGMPALPDTFWKRSLITKPKDREVVCHASAWNLDDQEDIRIKMCTKVNADDFETVHHELGHNIYQRAYKEQSPIYQTGAHDGFHEAIGDFIALSVTPDYLVKIGLLRKSQIPPASADIGLLMNRALDKIAFLPFGLLMDKWRWDVFSGKTKPEQYNDAWWALRKKYQGVRPPADRPADAFDPGGKYHIPNNVPYLRYFLSFIMQFQFHKAACEMAGWEGPLHRCSIYGNETVGKKFLAMMEKGASQPWPDTLELFTGTRKMDGSAIIEYFDPLIAYLKAQNKGKKCGW